MKTIHIVVLILCVFLASSPQHTVAAAEIVPENTQTLLNEQLLQAAQTPIDNTSKQTPAAQINHATRLVQRLLQQGASALYQDEETGNTALHYAIEFRWQHVTDIQRCKHFKFYIEDIQARQKHREPIILAGMIASLISAGADVRQKNHQGTTALDIRYKRFNYPDLRSRLSRQYRYDDELYDAIEKAIASRKNSCETILQEQLPEPLAQLITEYEESGERNCSCCWLLIP